MSKYSLTLLTVLFFVLVVGLSWAGTLSSYIQLVLMFVGVNIMMSSSLNLVNGYMGEFSCGHAGFMAVGAYTTSLLTVWFFTTGSVFGLNLLPPAWATVLFPLILLFGGLVAALAGLLVAIPSFRTRGDYLAIITLAVNYIVKSAIENIQPIGGARGFMGMGRVVNGMKEVADIPWMMIWTWIFAFLTILLIKRFVSSTYGRGLLRFGTTRSLPRSWASILEGQRWWPSCSLQDSQDWQEDFLPTSSVTSTLAASGL
jgi:branched-chain amino acid transport system permease protein